MPTAIGIGPIGGGNLVGNSIYGNTIAGLRNDSSLAIDAIGNWWGSRRRAEFAIESLSPKQPRR